MKNGVLVASLMFIGFASYQLATGRASGSNAFWLSIIFIGLGTAGLLVSALLPKSAKP